MRRFALVFASLVLSQAILSPVLAGGNYYGTGQTYYNGGYSPCYSAPAYYTPVIRELQYVVAAPAYGDYGAGTQYGGEQLRAKIERETREKIENEQLRKDLSEVKALLLQRQPAPAPQTQQVQWSGPAPVQQLPNWSGPAPVQQLQQPYKSQPAPSAQGWPASQTPTYPAPQPPLAPAPNGGPAVAAVIPPEPQTLQLLEAKCAKCHNPQTARGNFVMFAGPGTLSSTLTPGDVLRIEQRVGDGEMPPPESGVSVSNEEFAGIKGWRQANGDAIAAMLRGTRTR